MIRAATAADRPAVRSLQRFLDEPAPALLAAAFDAGVGSVLVAEPGDGTTDAVGYALSVPGDSGTGTTGEDPVVVYLAELVVAPAYRRRSVGARLVRTVGERCTGCDQLRVTTRADDGEARAFYRDQGFEHVADLPGHFVDAESRPDGTGDSDRCGRDCPGDDRRDGVLLVRDLQ